MATHVDTGWRKVAPGVCSCCGYADDWECDGRGNVFCSCQRCFECGCEPDAHYPECPISSREANDATDDEPVTFGGFCG